MAHRIPEGKKRYSVTLTIDDVTEFQSYVKEYGLASGTLSLAADDMVREMNKMFRRAKETGKLTIGDLFTILGENVQEAMKEVREDAEPTPEAKEVAKRNQKKKS
jgi:flagellar biosynthesis/type III secretory pathway ATPase